MAGKAMVFGGKQICILTPNLRLTNFVTLINIFNISEPLFSQYRHREFTI